MTAELPTLNRKLGPTPGATVFYREIAAHCKTLGKPSYNFGQGAETQQPGGNIAAILAEAVPTITSMTYPVKGGPKEWRGAIAAWVERFFAIHATAENTFMYGVQGRASLKSLFDMMAADARQRKIDSPAVLMADTHWPMLDNHIRKAGMVQKHYAMHTGNLAQVVRDALAADKNGKIFALYINSPDNPTGIRRTADEIRDTMAVLEEINKTRDPKVAMIFDTPYFMSCDQRGANAPSWLDAGFDGVLDGDLQTPWYVNISFSKAYGFATPGFHMMVVHPDYANTWEDEINETYGNAIEIGFAQKVTRIVAPENDAEALAHFAMLKDKYTLNRAALKKYFGDMVVEGDPNMTSLLELPGDFFERDTRIKDMNDFLEYAGQQKGVVFVNNGGTLARVAMAMKAEEFERGVQLLREAFDEIYKS